MTPENTERQLAAPEKQLAVQEPAVAAFGRHGIQITNMDEMARFCKAVANSGLAPTGLKTPEAIMIAVQHGLEIGLAPMQALQSIAVINGRPSLWGDAGLALVTSRADCEDVQEAIDENQATCTIKRCGRTAVTRTFSVADAKKANLWGKAGPWTNFPRRMLQMRARWWALRDAFPDALKGISGREEAQDMPEPKPIQRAKLIMPEGAAPPPSVQIEEKAEASPEDDTEHEWDAAPPPGTLL